MRMKSHVVLHGIKESKGEYEGRAFSSTTFHLEVDLGQNNAGRSIGRVTRPFKLGDASEFDKWAHNAAALPLHCEAVFELEAGKEDAKLKLVELVPISQKKAA
jgi:hypothetical protein